MLLNYTTNLKYIMKIKQKNKYFKEDVNLYLSNKGRSEGINKSDTIIHKCFQNCLL